MSGYDLASIIRRPGRVGLADVERVETLTAGLRAVDYQYGGGCCRDSVVALLAWGHQLLAADCSGAVRKRLCVAVADLHNLAGWASFDTGMVDAARRHFDYALELAKEGGNDALVANVLYRMGRVHLHHRSPEDALALFRLGQSVAGASGSSLMVSILSANQAWAFAKLGKTEDALRQLGGAQDKFARADVAEAPPWARFFDYADLHAMIGTVHTELALHADANHVRRAIPAFATALARYGEGTARSRAFNLVQLSLNHLLAGEVDHAAEVGAEAIDLAATVKSTRIKDRIWPLKKEADRRRDHPAAVELSDRILMFMGTLRAAA
ncbi:tetratricopeptide repeat protein [Amycolatopsis anabasis]|uniref:tetratricopeptide repeat protein n=1 Tax=Amycolatopsis anabasis TaxID=1840409 RepID=UPI00131BDA9F|nr:hypothetical protein [Amycolatopsis anabasis]